MSNSNNEVFVTQIRLPSGEVIEQHVREVKKEKIMNGTPKVKHEIYREKPKEKEKILLWKLGLDNENRPRLMISDDGGNEFWEVLILKKDGKWNTNSTVIKRHPEVFAQRKGGYDRVVCMWDEKKIGE